MFAELQKTNARIRMQTSIEAKATKIVGGPNARRPLAHKLQTAAQRPAA